MKHVTHTLFWNLFDSAGTQALLIIHYIALRSYIGISFHGALAAMLSLFYFILVVTNGGLDSSLAPFFKAITSTKKQAYSFAFRIIAPQWLLYSILALLFYLFFPHILTALTLYVPNCFLYAHQAFMRHTSTMLATYIALTFITESIKKTCKACLQLAFYTPITACVEFFGTICYLLLFWSAYNFGASITLEFSWLLLLLVSACQASILGVVLARFLNHLPGSVPKDSKSLPSAAYMRFFKTRLFTFANQLTAQLFTGNLLVPMAAFYQGLNTASFLKVITSMSHWVTLIAQKVFGISSSAFFAQLKDSDLAARRAFFMRISSQLHQALYALAIFLTINGAKLVAMQSDNSFSVPRWSTLYLMLIISFTESFFVVYDRWFLIEEKAFYTLGLNLISFSIIYALVYYTQCYAYFSPFILFIAIIGVRLLAFSFLSFFSYYFWRLAFTWRLQLSTLIMSLIFSLSFYFLV